MKIITKITSEFISVRDRSAYENEHNAYWQYPLIFSIVKNVCYFTILILIFSIIITCVIFSTKFVEAVDSSVNLNSQNIGSLSQNEDNTTFTNDAAPLDAKVNVSTLPTIQKSSQPFVIPFHTIRDSIPQQSIITPIVLANELLLSRLYRPLL